jgi:hypothetical protein
MKKITTVLAVGTALFACASPALADEMDRAGETSPAFTPSFAASRAGAVVDLWPTRNNFSTTFGGELQLRVADKLFVDLSYQAAFAHIGDAIDAGDNLGFGNPTIGVHIADAPSRNFAYFVGVGVTAPVLQDPGDEAANAAFYGQRIRGYYEADRFTSGYMAARVGVGMEWQGARPFILRGELRPVVYIPTNDRYAAFPKDRTGLPTTDRGATEVTIEHAMDLELRADMGLGGGVRLAGTLMPTHDDMIQVVAEPFLQMTPKRQGLYARLSFPVAIDEDLGFGLTEEDKLAAIRVNIGGQW